MQPTAGAKWVEGWCCLHWGHAISMWSLFKSNEYPGVLVKMLCAISHLTVTAFCLGEFDLFSEDFVMTHLQAMWRDPRQKPMTLALPYLCTWTEPDVAEFWLHETFVVMSGC